MHYLRCDTSCAGERENRWRRTGSDAIRFAKTFARAAGQLVSGLTVNSFCIEGLGVVFSTGPLSTSQVNICVARVLSAGVWAANITALCRLTLFSYVSQNTSGLSPGVIPVCSMPGVSMAGLAMRSGCVVLILDLIQRSEAEGATDDVNATDSVLATINQLMRTIPISQSLPNGASMCIQVR